MRENRSGGVLPRSSASNIGRNVSIEARAFAARRLRTSESRLTMRRRSASMRVGTQRRRRYQRIDTEHRSLLSGSGPNSEPSLVIGIAKGTKQLKTVEVNP